MLTVLNEFGAFPAVIEAELERYLPFLATTKFLMAAVKAGVGREAAHEVIKEHAVKAALGMREGKSNTLLNDLANDERFPLDRAAINQLISAPLEFTGDARQQVARVVNRIEAITSAHPAACSTSPALFGERLRPSWPTASAFDTWVDSSAHRKSTRLIHQ